MAIPTNITREHVFRAMIRIIKKGAPPKRNMREWALEYEGDLYPVKLLISWANVFPNKVELPFYASVFTTTMGQKYLIKLGFTIVKIQKLKNNMSI
tara:strand:+ start:246 stop:533 length:288 start_codon:yes stop_codon:yes gene_type:complete